MLARHPGQCGSAGKWLRKLRTDMQGLPVIKLLAQWGLPQGRQPPVDAEIDRAAGVHAQDHANHRLHHALVGRDQLAGAAGFLGELAQQALRRGAAHTDRKQVVARMAPMMAIGRGSGLVSMRSCGWDCMLWAPLVP